MTNAGNWTVLTNGDKLWTMEISSPNALSINLLYDKFWLPEGTSLFLYSKDKNNIWVALLLLIIKETPLI